MKRVFVIAVSLGVGMAGMRSSDGAQAVQPFFQARGAARCAALHHWTDGIQARAPGVDLYNSVSPGIVNVAAPSFEDAVFAESFGKTVAGLSDRDKASIQDALRDCYPGATWQSTLVTGFETNPKRMDMAWREMLARVSAQSTREMPAPLPVRAPAVAEVFNESPYLMIGRNKVSLQRLTLNPCPNRRTTDVFFAPDVYAAIANLDSYDPRGLVDGTQVDCSLRDTKLTVADIESAAAETFIRRLDGASIPRTEALQALHEGRFNPAWEDLVLAWRGLVRMNGNSLPPATVAAMQRDGRWNSGWPDRNLIEPFVLAARPATWKARFGDYEQLPPGDFLRDLFTALASGTSPPPAAGARYASVRSEGSYGQRMAVIVRDSAAQRAIQEAEAERLANMSEGERFMAALDTLLSPLDRQFDRIDDLEESLLDPGGALFMGSGGANKGVASITLCNESGTELRIASVINRRDRRDRFNVQAVEYLARGWSSLAVGQCAALRVGSSNAALLAIQCRSGNRFVSCGVKPDATESSDLNDVVSRMIPQSRYVCGRTSGNFTLSATEPESLMRCAEGHEQIPLNQLVQHADNIEYRVTLGRSE